MASVPQQLIAPTVSQEALQTLHQSVAGFDREQLIWSSGFLAGLAGSATLPETLPVANPAAIPVAAPVAAIHWHIFYATETGNSRHVAEQLAARYEQAGTRASVTDLRDAKPRSLAKIEYAAFVIATHGVGEPPEGSEPFFEHWLSDSAPQLTQLKYSVLALGDSSYVDFCETGRQLDQRLTELGARAIMPRVECDLDFDDAAAAWTGDLLAQTRQTDSESMQTRVPQLKAVVATGAVSKARPFASEIIARQRITGTGSARDVRHVELDLSGSGLVYQPGDSLGVVAQNSAATVESILHAKRFSGDERILLGAQELSLSEALQQRKEITVLSRPTLELGAPEHPRLRAILDDRAQLADYFSTRQLIDFVHDYEIEQTPQAFADSLRGLTPRLYSIASSPDANPDEAHLTVAVVNYERFGRGHVGTASGFLAGEHTHAPVYVEANDNFRLPADPATPVIMIGAGTGVAPYRAFVEHRREHGASGDNWLVYGDRSLADDFLYQIEWLRHRRDGFLKHLDVAFSRDQASKLYVQHRLVENGRKVYEWLERGANIYVCGDATHMAVDVHTALHEIVRTHAAMSDDSAHEYLQQLKQTRRYQRDVY